MTTKTAQKPGDLPFWKTKTLAEMNDAEWESLCDGCGLCCLNKLGRGHPGEAAGPSTRGVLPGGEGWRWWDTETRRATAPACPGLRGGSAAEISWPPPPCGSRLIRDGHDLYWWHPLVSGDPDTVHQAGISARGRTVSEEGLDIDDYEDYLVTWPLEVGEGK